MSGRATLCIFAHYDQKNVVAPYVIYYLRSLRAIVNHIVFVSTSSLSQLDIELVGRSCDEIILRDNIGYDFCSYRVGLESVDLRSFDQVLLCNDSVYGPFKSLELLMESSRLGALDFWGITESYNPAHHVQSYFMAFQSGVIHSPEFSSFWKNVEPLPTKSDVIEQYELGLSQCLRRAGFTCGAWFPSRRMTGFGRIFRYPRHYLQMFRARWRDPLLYVGLLRNATRKAGVNPSHYEWKHMLAIGKCMFLKVALFRGETNVYHDPNQSLEFISSHTSYPVELIRNHIGRN